MREKGLVIPMTRSTLLVRSVTDAVKGQQVLSRFGISAQIVRNAHHTSAGGCGYGLAVDCNPVMAQNRLQYAGIGVLGIVRG